MSLTSSRRWLAVAIGSLILAGLFALVPVLGRTPGFKDLITDPTFARRSLVLHVNLALTVWFFAYLACLFGLLPSSESIWRSSSAGLPLALTGMVILVACWALTPARPIMSNYIPMLDHPLFLVGLLVFGVAVALSFLGGGLLRARPDDTEGDLLPLPPAACVGLRAAAAAFLIAMLTFVVSGLVTGHDQSARAYFEKLFWGGGHVLQAASVAGMLVVWVIMLSQLLDRPVLSRGAARWLFGALVLPLLLAPLLAWQAHYRGFTLLMRFGIFGPVLVAIALCVRALARARREGTLPRGAFRDLRFLAFGVSATMTVLGFGLGALIRSSNTLIPAHYHVSIGAVTAAYMAMTFVLLEAFGYAPLGAARARLSRWQPVLFGVGQSVLGVGMGLAGVGGAPRKVYGAEQHLRTAWEIGGLVIMAVGGLITVAGGGLFLWLVLTTWVRQRATVKMRLA